MKRLIPALALLAACQNAPARTPPAAAPPDAPSWRAVDPENVILFDMGDHGTIAIGEVIHGCLPFIASMVVLIALLIALPETATWLPATLK